MKKIYRKITALALTMTLLSHNQVCGNYYKHTYIQKEVSVEEVKPIFPKYEIPVIDLKTERVLKKPIAKKYVKGWTTTSVNVRKGPSTDADILETLSLNDEISYTNFNSNWVEIKYGDDIAYICKDYISDTKLDYTTYSVPKNSGFKSFMGYTTITSKTSDQYKLQHTKAYTGKYGIRQVDGRYCVAVGSHFTSEIGTLFDLVLENGTVIPCILADQKADIDTDSQNIVTKHNGCLSEFVVDMNHLDAMAKRMGDISHCDDSWDSPVETIKVYNL